MVAAMEPERMVSGKKRDSCLASGAYLVKDAAIIGGDIVGVEEETFLHCIVSVMAGMLGNGTRYYIA